MRKRNVHEWTWVMGMNHADQVLQQEQAAIYSYAWMVTWQYEGVLYWMIESLRRVWGVGFVRQSSDARSPRLLSGPKWDPILYSWPSHHIMPVLCTSYKMNGQDWIDGSQVDIYLPQNQNACLNISLSFFCSAFVDSFQHRITQFVNKKHNLKKGRST